MAIWPFPSAFPVAVDNLVGVGVQIDNVTVVWANHPNSLASAVDALQAKLNIDNALIQGTGGLEFDPIGQASNPAAPGNPSVWVKNTGVPGFSLQYTDDLGVDHNLVSQRKAAVIDYVDCTAAPPTEVQGDRYILDDTVGAVHANWDGAAKLDIVDFNGTTWDAYTPEEGWECLVDLMNKIALFVDDAPVPAHWEFNSPGGAVDPDGYIFVDNDNGNDVTGDGSSSNPYQTFAFAASTVVAPLNWGEFNAPVTFVVAGTHAGAITLPYRREISIVGGPAIISGKITWPYDIDYWFGNSPVTYLGSLMIRPYMPQGFDIYDIECLNAVDKVTCGWRRLGIKDAWLFGDILNLESGNAVNGRQTGELVTLLENCETGPGVSAYIGGQRETVMASAWNNSVVLLTNWCELIHEVAGCASFYRCVDTQFGDVDWERDPTTGAPAYLGCIGGTNHGLRDCTFPGGGIFGWDGVTGNAPGDIPMDSNTFDSIETGGVTYNNVDYILIDKAYGVALDESAFLGNLYPATAGDSDTVQKGLDQFDEYLGAGESVIVVKRGANDAASGTNLLAAYVRAAALTPGGNALAKTNRALLRIPAGNYDISGAAAWAIDTDFVDIEGFGEASWSLPFLTDAPPAVTITSTNAAATSLLDIGVDDANISSIAVDQGTRTCTSVIEFTDDFARGHMTNVVVTLTTATFAVHATPASFGGTFDHIVTEGAFLSGGTVYSTVRNSFLGANSLGGHESGGARDCIFYGKAEHVVCGNYSFGASASQDVGFSGLAVFCTAGEGSFGFTQGVLKVATFDGEVYNCEAGQWSFGHAASGTVNVTGRMFDCESTGDDSFGSGNTVNLTAAKFYRCLGVGDSFGHSAAGACTVDASTVFEDCHAGVQSFCFSGDAHASYSAVATKCTGGNYCFGVSFANTGQTTFSGETHQCRAGTHSFGYSNSTAAALVFSGEAYNCVAGNYSFCHEAATRDASFTGKAVNCEGGEGSFGYADDAMSISGEMRTCKASHNSFGHSVSDFGSLTASAIFRNCEGGNYCFGYGGAEADILAGAELIDCRAGTYSFGAAITDPVYVRGRLERCVAGSRSFGYCTNEAADLQSTAVLIDCECTGDYAFAAVITAPDATISGARIVRCKSGDYSFASAGTSGEAVITAPSVLEGCDASDCSFCYSADDHANYAGTATDCRGGTYCFGASAAATGQTTFSGEAHQCRAGTHSFGSSNSTTAGITWSGEAHGCVAGANSFCFELNDQTFTISGRMFDCKAGQHSFGYGGANADGVITGEFHNCIGRGEYCFGFGENITLTGAEFYRCILTVAGGFGLAVQVLTTDAATLFESCEAQSASFGGTQVGLCTVAATFNNCVAGDHSFGGTAGAAGVAFSGKAYNCRGGDYCFGSTFEFTGEAYDCYATSNSFGGNNDNNAGILVGCRCIGRTQGRKMIGGRMERCVFTKTAGVDGVILADSTATAPQLYGCILINDGVVVTVDSFNVADDVKMAHCRLNNSIDITVTNLIGVGYNVVDTDVTYP